jgi:PAP2 superfamily
MTRIPVALAIFVSSFGQIASLKAANATEQPADAVIQWNRTLLEIVRTPPAPGAKPPTVHPTRSFAIMHAAIYDAVNAIEKTHSDYLIHITAPQQASPDAAVVQAAHDTLIALYPQKKEMIETHLNESLSEIPDAPGKNQGVQVGQGAAKRILALRAKDGSEAQPPPHAAGTKPGAYQKTPPNLPEPVFTHWSRVKPFTLISAEQFRPGPPPELASADYTAAYQEVRELGGKTSTSRSEDQTASAKFWSGKIQNYWNEIAQTAALSHHNTLAQNARLFALLNLTFADDAIAFYEAKYTYNFWRPVTAIQAGDSDNNPETTPDPNWMPLADTPPDPSYPGAHSVVSASGAAILNSFFGGADASFSVHSETSAGTERSFTSFTAAATEAGLSRTYIGHHYRFDDAAGQAQGRQIADHVFKNFLVAQPATPP